MLVLWSADITVLTLRGLKGISAQEILEEQGDGRNHGRRDTHRLLRVGVVGKGIVLLKGSMVCAMGSSKGYWVVVIIRAASFGIKYITRHFDKGVSNASQNKNNNFSESP